MILALNNISKAFGTAQILENVSFNIENREKIAVTGVNGAGKSTLFKIITGELSHDTGDVIMPKGTRIGYFSQNLEIDSENTIYGELMTVFEPVIKIEEQLRDMESRMADTSGDEYDNLMAAYSELSQEFEEKHGYEYQSRLRGVISGLGFSENERYQVIHELSGGQKTRVALGKLLLAEPDLLLLDEPTNHLDIEMIQWLENYLNNYNGSIIIISHDRYFLDKVATKVIEIENRKVKIFYGNYTYYVQKKKTDRETEYRHYVNRLKEIKHEEEVIKKLREFNREKSIKRAESREKLLKKKDRAEAPENLPDKMRFEIKPERESGFDVLTVENLSMGFDKHMLFKNISFDIKKGEKAALIGPNGIGKTTLLRIILGKINALSGCCKTGSSVITGYYDQEQADLDLNKTIFDEISDAYPALNNTKIRNVLAAFVFKGDDVFKTIGTLSGGEKGRVALAKIMLSNANFLILDEPTNHLDTNSKEILENVLKDYTGTVLYISHDRYFINNTAQKVVELTQNSAVTYLGNYDYYIEKKEASLPDAADENEKKMTETKLSRIKQKELQAQQRKKENAIKKIEEEIEDTENKIAYLDGILNDENLASDAEKLGKTYDQKDRLEAELAELYDKWEDANK